MVDLISKLLVFFIAAFLLHGGVQITLMLWVPDPERVYLFYIFAALWGMGDAVIQTQINGKKFMYINLTLASLLSLLRFWLRGQRDTKWADIKILKKEIREESKKFVTISKDFFGQKDNKI